MYNSHMKWLGSDGLNWSSQARYDVRYAHELSFDVSSVYPSRYGLDRYYGFPLRCLARQ